MTCTPWAEFQKRF